MQRISAKHIDFIDYIPGAEPGIPRATSSLTLRIHQTAMSRDTRTVGRSICNILDQHQSILDIQCLKLVGLILIPATRIDITLVVFDHIAKHIRKTMIARLHTETLQTFASAYSLIPVPKERLGRCGALTRPLRAIESESEDITITIFPRR